MSWKDNLDITFGAALTNIAFVFQQNGNCFKYPSNRELVNSYPNTCTDARAVPARLKWKKSVLLTMISGYWLDTGHLLEPDTDWHKAYLQAGGIPFAREVLWLTLKPRTISFLLYNSQVHIRQNWGNEYHKKDFSDAQTNLGCSKCKKMGSIS